MAEIFRPGIDAGLSYVAAPERIVQAARGASLQAIAASEHDSINRRLRVEGFDRLQARRIAVIASSPVVMENVRYVRDYFLVNGKGVLSGHAGDRFLAGIPGAERASPRYNAEVLGTSTRIPVWSGPLPRTYTINCRNFFNLYHFMTETMPLLMCLKALEPSQRPEEIRIVSLDHKVVRAFITGFLGALLGEMAERIVYSSAEREASEGRETFGRVLSSYNHRYYISQTDLGADDLFKKDLAAENRFWGSLDRSLRKSFMRNFSIDAGFRAINRVRFDWDGPRRVFIVRKTGRDRYNGTIGALRAKLEREGFVPLAMEDLTPRQQIAMWGNAEVVVGEHGAAFAGMMFARPETVAIELGNLQTRDKRWGDFFCCAHASGCHYINVLADVDCADPLAPPPMSEGHRGPRLGPRATEAVMSCATGPHSAA